MDISAEDLEFLKHLETTDPEFVQQYMGGTMPSSEKTITVRMCAQRLGVCQNTVLKQIHSGNLKADFFENRWMIKESDLQKYLASGNVARGRGGNSSRQTRKPTESTMKPNGHLYTKATSQNVTDFLHSWHRNTSAGFSLVTICRDFNRVSEVPVTEVQMSGILSSLRRKDIVIRKGKGIYQVSPSIIENTKQDDPVADVASADVMPEPAIIAPDGRRGVIFKKKERQAVENFILENADPTEDFVFSINDIAKKNRQMDRKKIGKACNNMCYLGKLTKGRSLGEYICLATQLKDIPAAPEASVVAESRPVVADAISPAKSDVMDKVKTIMDSNFDESLKLEILRKFLS